MPAPPRQPQRKGKGERRVRNHRAALDPYGRCFRDLADLQAWTDVRLAARAAERRGLFAEVGDGVAEAVGRALAGCSAEDGVLVTGSLYVVGEARAAIGRGIG